MELEAFEVSKMLRPPYLLLSWFFLGFSFSLACGISARNISSVSGFVPARGEPEECPVEREFVPFSWPAGEQSSLQRA